MFSLLDVFYTVMLHAVPVKDIYKKFRISLTSCFVFSSTGDSGKVTTVVATPGQGPDRPQEVSYTDIKVIGNGSFGVVYQARLIDSQEMVAIKKVLQDKRFKVSINRLTWSNNYSKAGIVQYNLKVDKKKSF